MKDSGQIWIKINNKDENETIYQEFTQDKYADKDLEGHYNSLIPNINSHIKSKSHIEKLTNEIQKQKIETTILQNYPKNYSKINYNKIKILLLNAQGLKDYSKRLYLTNLYEENIHIALLQGIHYETNEKMYIKVFKTFRSDGHNHRKGVVALINIKIKIFVLIKNFIKN